MSRLVRLDVHKQLQDACRDAGDRTLSYRGAGGSGGTYGRANALIRQPDYFTVHHLSFDAVRDYIIITTGNITRWSGYSLVYDDDNIPHTQAEDWVHILLKADTVDPRKSFETDGLGAYLFPAEGAVHGYFTDPHTNVLYSCYEYNIFPETQIERESTPIGAGRLIYGERKFVFSAPNPGTTYWLSASANLGEDWRQNTNGQFMPGAAYDIGVNLPIPMINAITLDDLIVYFGGSYLWANVRFGSSPTPVYKGARTWASTSPAMALAPAGRDKIFIAWFSNSPGGTSTSSIWCAIMRFNRSKDRFEIENVDILPSSSAFAPRFHSGCMTYDYTRNTIVVLEPDPDNTGDYMLCRYVFSDYCHRSTPDLLTAPSPLGPVQAGRDQTFDIGAYAAVMPHPVYGMRIEYSNTNTVLDADFTIKPNAILGSDTTGAGRYTIGLRSSAENKILDMQARAEGYSYAVCALIVGTGPVDTPYTGILYGADPVTILSSSANFNVSGFISAANQTTTTGTATILAGKLPLVTDSVGAGSPRHLIYPTNLLATPLVYELNPHRWTNMADEALIRPLYAVTRTLRKTVSTIFDGDVTDLEIKEVWTGGGGRASMSYSFFTQLYDYFYNVPDIETEGYIQWAPRDLNNHIYNVIITGLSIGSENDIALDTFAKAGYIAETVTMTMRIISVES